MGGGVHCTSSNPILTNCTITYNSAYDEGGGIRRGTLNNCTLSRNSCTVIGWGGGSSGSTLNNCNVFSNSCLASAGGGTALSVLNNCRVFGNSAVQSGGGSFMGELNNCTVFGNSAAESGGGTFMGELNNCIVWNNTASNELNSSQAAAIFSCSPDLTNGVDGNITNAPLFIDADNGDFRLMNGSPCIDSATNLPSLTSDLDGNPRPLDGNFDEIAAYDMGAYEYDPEQTDSDSDGLNDEEEVNTYGTNPLNVDTDGDSRTDGNEVDMGWSPIFDEAPVIADVTNDPASYGLFTSNSIMDLNMGYMMLQTSNNMMHIGLQLRQCTNLIEGVWTNAGEAVNWTLSAPDGKSFYRVRGGE